MNDIETLLFPSPTGVLYLLILWGKVKEISIIEFPSPTGVLYLLILFILQIISHKKVSVPYWGSLSSNGAGECYGTYRHRVSVPYWGSLSSNIINMYLKVQPIVSVPYWGSLSSNLMNECGIGSKSKSFRPLLGFSIF